MPLPYLPAALTEGVTEPPLGRAGEDRASMSLDASHMYTGVAQVPSLPSVKGAMQKPALTSEEGWRHVWFAVVAMVSVSVLSTQAQKAAKTKGVD